MRFQPHWGVHGNTFALPWPKVLKERRLHSLKTFTVLLKPWKTQKFCPVNISCLQYCAGLQTNILSIFCYTIPPGTCKEAYYWQGLNAYIYMCKLYVKCRSHEFFNCLDCEFLNQKNFSKAKSSPFGKIYTYENDHCTACS